jgi:peptide chain release factor subunit 1
MLSEIEKAIDNDEERTAFQRDAQLVREFVAEYAPKRKTLVLFADASRSLLKSHDLETPLTNCARWRPMPYLRPLAEAHDEYERYAVVLADRARARLFILFMGEIEEEQQALAEADVHQFDASGKDKMWSQMIFQRKADEHAKHHFKRVGALLDGLELKGRFERLIVAGPDEAPDELVKQFPERLRRLTIGRLPMSLQASAKDVVEATRPLVRNFERSDEIEIVQKLLTTAAKNAKAVIGLDNTVDICLRGRVRTLVYSPDAVFDSQRSEKCLQRIAEARQAAGEEPEPPAENILDWLVWTTLSYGGAIECVHEDAAERLKHEGNGVGAFLR